MGVCAGPPLRFLHGSCPHPLLAPLGDIVTLVGPPLSTANKPQSQTEGVHMLTSYLSLDKHEQIQIKEAVVLHRFLLLSGNKHLKCSHRDLDFKVTLRTIWWLYHQRSILWKNGIFHTASERKTIVVNTNPVHDCAAILPDVMYMPGLKKTRRHHISDVSWKLPSQCKHERPHF